MASLSDTGTVDEQPVPQILIGARARELTGRLQIDDLSGQRSTVFLRGGRPVHVDRPDTLDRLDHVLVQERLVPAKVIVRAARIQQETGRLLGEVLRELGILGPEKLQQSLRMQLSRKIVRLFTPDRGTFELVAEEHRFGADAQSPGIALETRPLIYPGIRATYDDLRLAQALASLNDAIIRLVPTAEPAVLKEAGFPDLDPLLIRLASGGVKVDAAWLAGPQEAKAAVLALRYLDLLVVERPPPPRQIEVVFAPKPAPEPAPPPKVEVRPEPKPQPKPEPRVEPKPEPNPAAAAPTSLSTLDPAQVARAAETSFRSGDWARAEEAFDSLAKSEPKNLRWKAFLTRIRLWKGGPPTGTLAADAVKAFKQALAFDGNFAWGFHFLGEALKLQNELTAAERAFRTAKRMDSTLFEAERELRLITMRKGRR